MRLIALAILLLLLTSLSFAYNDTIQLRCTDNKTLEHETAWQKAHNPCWGWLPTHTYDLAAESGGEVRYIRELNVSHHTGLSNGCASASEIMVSNSTDGGWKVIGEIRMIAYQPVLRSFSDVGAYRYVRIANSECYVDGSAINVTFNETADLYINESEIWVASANGTVSDGDVVNFTVTVHNIGKVNASNFTVRFKDDNNPEDISRGAVVEQQVRFLAANASANVTFAWNVTGGSREVSFFADSGKQVRESNETNNIAFYWLRISQPPQPDYLAYLAAGGAALIIIAIAALGLLLWRALSFRKPAEAGGMCPRCGMLLAPGARKCPVCGKKLTP